MKDVKTIIEAEVSEVFALERSMTEVENELQSNPKFIKFLELQKSVNEKAKEVWDKVSEQMIEAYKNGKVEKTLKFDFGTLTIAETNDLDIDTEVLAPRFYKSVPDTTKIRTMYNLEGVLPKGVTASKKYQFRKSLKVGE